MRPAISALLLCLTAAPAAGAPSAILCLGDAGTAIIQLEGMPLDGRTLNCIDAPFVDPYTPCAAPDAFTLYEDGFRAKIDRIVDRPEDYAHHTGSLMGHKTSAAGMTFTAGYTSPDSGYVEVWSFTVMKASDAGVFRTGTSEVRYTCMGLVE